MYKIEVPKPINQLIAFYHRLGIWRNEEGNIYFDWGRKSVYFISYLTFCISLAMGAIQSDNAGEMILLATVSIQYFVVAAKLVYLLLKEAEISHFIHDMGVHSIKDREEFLVVNKKIKNFVNFVRFFVGMIFFALLMIFSFPLISKKLLFNISFPFKGSEIGFWVAYVFETFGVLIAVVSAFLNIIIWFLMMSYSIKYHILGSEFRNCGSNRSTNTIVQNQQQQQYHFPKDLITCINTHRSVQKEVDRFKLCFSNLFMAQILTSAACICGSIFVQVFSTHEGLFLSCYNGSFMAYNIFDIFVVLYFGNEITLKSGELSYCLFESNWIDQWKGTKQNIIILVEVLKQSHDLVIYKLYPMNLFTFTSILKLSYSMFNILQNVK